MNDFSLKNECSVSSDGISYRLKILGIIQKFNYSKMILMKMLGPEMASTHIKEVVFNINVRVVSGELKIVPSGIGEVINQTIKDVILNRYNDKLLVEYDRLYSKHLSDDINYKKISFEELMR